MTQYEYEVAKQRVMLEAEAWKNGVRSLHVHSMNSMWYDNRPQDTEKHSVTDIEYNDRSIIRTLFDGTKIIMQEGLKREELLAEFERKNQ